MNKATDRQNVPFINPILHTVYSKNLLRKYSFENVPYGNAKSTKIGNANFMLYGMDKKREKFDIKKIEKKKRKVKIYLTGNLQQMKKTLHHSPQPK